MTPFRKTLASEFASLLIISVSPVGTIASGPRSGRDAQFQDP
jgi:hypothetical protein